MTKRWRACLVIGCIHRLFFFTALQRDLNVEIAAAADSLFSPLVHQTSFNQLPSVNPILFFSWRKSSSSKHENPHCGESHIYSSSVDDDDDKYKVSGYGA